MATQFTEAVQVGQRIDDSEFKNFNGELVRRPVPKEERAELQLLLTNLLVVLAKQVACKAWQEWSISDNHGHWLTPDATVAPPGCQ